MAQAGNVTKFTAGGSGDNIVPDGYIKTVEKVWIDSYTIGFTNTNTTIDIAVLPPNKKITGVTAYIYTTASQTNGTVSIGFNSDSAVSSLMAPVTISHNLTATSLNLWGSGITQFATATSGTVSVGALSGFQLVTSGTQTTVAIKLNNWTSTTGTVKTVVRYT